MRSAVLDILPSQVRRSWKFELIVHRRRKRRQTTRMAERLGVSRATYARMEKGDPTVALGAYAQGLFVLGFGLVFGDLIDQRRDDQGLLLDLDRLPKRVQLKRGRRQTKQYPRLLGDVAVTSENGATIGRPGMRLRGDPDS
jgi:transcriptional regulator with XRE-family HTH domain